MATFDSDTSTERPSTTFDTPRGSSLPGEEERSKKSKNKDSKMRENLVFVQGNSPKGLALDDNSDNESVAPFSTYLRKSTRYKKSESSSSKKSSTRMVRTTIKESTYNRTYPLTVINEEEELQESW